MRSNPYIRLPTPLGSGVRGPLSGSGNLCDQERSIWLWVCLQKAYVAIDINLLADVKKA